MRERMPSLCQRQHQPPAATSSTPGCLREGRSFPSLALWQGPFTTWPSRASTSTGRSMPSLKLGELHLDFPTQTLPKHTAQPEIDFKSCLPVCALKSNYSALLLVIEMMNSMGRAGVKMTQLHYIKSVDFSSPCTVALNRVRRRYKISVRVHLCLDNIVRRHIMMSLGN